MSLLETASNAPAAFESIPVIDLAGASDPSVKPELAKQVRDACMNVGFLYVKNHDIPEECIQNALSALKEFFALPLETKMKIHFKNTPNFKGYSPLLSGNIDSNNNGDLQEGFELGPEDIEVNENDEKRSKDGAMSGANVWPEEMPSFREAVLRYYQAAVNLGKLLFPLFALALDLPENFFDDKTQNTAAIMRLLHYPPQTGPVDDRIVGIGAHTDFECFTILWQEPGIQALQVLNANKQWIDAPPIPGTLVINLGDQFARWTNDIFKSTVHRAINRSGVRRYSIPLFFGTDYNVMLEPIPSCISSDCPPKYDVVSAGDYVKERLRATYNH